MKSEKPKHILSIASLLTKLSLSFKTFIRYARVIYELNEKLEQALTHL
jgi:hypothetical protein